MAPFPRGAGAFDVTVANQMNQVTCVLLSKCLENGQLSFLCNYKNLFKHLTAQHLKYMFFPSQQLANQNENCIL